MNFEEYKFVKDDLLDDNTKEYLRLDCLNPFKAMDFLLKNVEIDESIEVTKEMLLDLWKKENKINYDFTITRGVRDSLNIISNNFKDKKFIIPSDVYPKYVYITDKLENRVFYNLNNYGLLNINVEVSNSLLLLECPITPEGRVLNKEEINHLLKFLKEKSNIIVIDTVYVYDVLKVFDLLKPLILTNQCIILHSLSKTYLSPEVLGINYIPNKLKEQIDFSYVYNLYPLKDEGYSLKRAYNIIQNKPELPYLQEEIFKSEFEILKKQKVIKVKENPKEEYMSYFRKINKTFEEGILNNIMTVPTSIFSVNSIKTPLNDGSVVTCLYYLSSTYNQDNS